MAKAQIAGGELHAAAVDRVVEGVLVPYGVEGRTNLGRVTIDPGVLTVPKDPAGTMVLNREHDRSDPIGRVAELVEGPTGLFASFRIADGPEGDAALDEIRTGKRKHLSVEAVIDVSGGRVVRGRVFAAALVERPAFDGAVLLAAEDTNPDPNVTETEETVEETGPDGSVVETTTKVREELEDLGDGKTQVTRTTTVVQTITPAEPGNGGAPVPEETIPAATVPPTLLGRFAPPAAAATPAVPPAPAGMTARSLFARLAEAHRTRDRRLLDELRDEGERGAVMFGALTDITTTTGTNPIATTIAQPQWIGEIWSGRAYDRRYWGLFTPKPLTSFEIAGFRWTTKPGVGPWGGNKTNVPSGPVGVEPYREGIEGLAGAHDIDRRFRDFSVPEFWDGYFRHMTDSYARQSDEGALAKVIAAATPVAAGTVPAGVSPGLVSIVDGALAVLDEGVPTFAVVAKDVWRDLLLTPKDKVAEYIESALGLEEGRAAGFRIIPGRTGDLAAGRVLVGVGSAVDAYELPGSPIRVEGLDMAKGGIDPGLFGYWQTIVRETAAVALVTPAGAAA